MREDVKDGRGRIVLAVKGVLLVVFVALLGRALLEADWAGASSRLRGVGPAIVLVLLPFPLALALDATAWKLLFRRIDRRVPLVRLFRVRVQTESVTTALPAGGLVAEALAPFLLAADVPMPASFTSSATKRWLIIRTHGYYVAIAGLAGFGLLAAASQPLLRHGGLPWIVLACAVGLVGVSFALETMTTRLGLAARAHDALARLRGSRFLARLRIPVVPRESFETVDEHLASFGRAVHPLPAALVLGAWLLESVETWIILRVLGVEVPWVVVLSFDAALSVVRTAAAFAPAGLGAQDLGYLAFFAAYGLPSPAAIGPAFLLLKRSKEILYVTLGFTILFLGRRSKAEDAPDSDELEPAA